MDVVLVRVPVLAARRLQRSEAGTPRLLLLDDGNEPPDPADCIEDWIRVPASEADIRARIAGLGCRSSHHGGPSPLLDRDGVLRVGPAWVPLPPVEARLTEALLDRMDAVVSRDALARAGWPEGAPGRNALDVHVLRLRRRLAHVGLAIRTVRSRGYLLEVASRARQAL